MTQPGTEFDRPSIVGSLPISIADESAAALLRGSFPKTAKEVA